MEPGRWAAGLIRRIIFLVALVLVILFVVTLVLRSVSDAPGDEVTTVEERRV